MVIYFKYILRIYRDSNWQEILFCNYFSNIYQMQYIILIVYFHQIFLNIIPNRKMISLPPPISLFFHPPNLFRKKTPVTVHWSFLRCFIQYFLGFQLSLLALVDEFLSTTCPSHRQRRNHLPYKQD